MEKNRKSMELIHKKNGNIILKVEDEEPEISSELNVLQKELLNLDQKVSKVESQINQQDKMHQDIETKMTEQKELQNKLVTEATGLSIDMNGKEGKSDLDEKYNLLNNKKENLDKNINSFEKKLIVMSNEYNQKSPARLLNLDPKAVAAIKGPDVRFEDGRFVLA